MQGRLIEVLTGKKLGEAVAERVLQPLGMVDTGFQVPAAKVARAAQPGPRPNGQPMTPRFKVDDGAKYELGGGGMLSTMEDYLRFTMALANGGAFQGKRIIGKQTLDFMTADHVGNRPGRPPGLGFGLGFEVRTRVGDSAIAGSVGEYGWAGNAGTLFWIDPKEQLIAIYMVQVSDPDRDRAAQPLPDDGAGRDHRLEEPPQGGGLLMLRRSIFALAGLLLAGPVGRGAQQPLKIALIYGKTGPLEAYAKQTEAGFMLGLEYADQGHDGGRRPQDRGHRQGRPAQARPAARPRSSRPMATTRPTSRSARPARRSRSPCCRSPRNTRRS